MALGGSAAASHDDALMATVLTALDRLGGGLLVRRGTAIGASWRQGGNGAHCRTPLGDEAFL